MKVLFFGSSEFSIPFIETLIDSHHKIIKVFTGSDKERGRGKILSPNPVKSHAVNRKLPVFTIGSFDSDFYKTVIDLDFDYAVSVSFGKIFPERFLEIAHDRTINIHPSILPKYRGPSPIISALLAGDRITGVTLIKIDKKIDSGDIYMQKSLAISEKENKDMLEEKLACLGTKMLVELLELLENKKVTAFPQPETGISYTRLCSSNDTIIDWKKSSTQIINKIRAFGFSPGSRTTFKGKMIKILYASYASNPYPENKDLFKSGQVAKADKQGLIIKCGTGYKVSGDANDNFISLQKLKPQNKNSMDYTDFLNGYKVRPGDLFE